MNLNSYSQTILAGQISGDNIVHVDIDDVLLSTSNGNYEYLDLDIDMDGQDDLRLYCFYNSFHTGYEEGSRTSTYHSTKVCTYTDHNWVKQYYASDTIGSGCNWSPGAIIRKYSYDITTGEYYSGDYYGFGYIGFMIPYSTDTITGWIYIRSNSVSSLWVYEYAFYSVTASSDPREMNKINIKYNSPAGDILYLKFSDEIVCSNLTYIIFDIEGKEQMKGLIQDKTEQIRVSNLPSGFYVTRITGPGSTPGTFKFFKE
jgi:hypothetical protein